MRRVSSSDICRASLIALALVTGCGEDDAAPESGTGKDTTAPGDTSGGDTTGTDGVDGADSADTTVFENGCKNDSECAGVVFADLGVCEISACNLEKKQCERRNAADGTACSDSDGCTTSDQCKLGVCAGSTKTCDDSNPCTNDACNPTTGDCDATPNTALCDDGEFCTTNDQCGGGKCGGAANPKCQCENDADCAKLDDADKCNGTLECKDLQCIAKGGTEVTCADTGNDPCGTTACNPTSGECETTPAGDGQGCDDGDKCTKSDRCAAGKCTGKAVTCDDKNACTTDSCDPTDGCKTADLDGACDDGDPCTTDDACKSGTCGGTANPACACTTTADCAASEDGDLCNGTLKCDAGKCVVDTATVADCSDEQAAAAACKPVVCEPTTGKCEARTALDGATCDDKSKCTTGDSCKEGKCTGAELVCDDKNPCTDDSCAPANGCETKANTAGCDDGNECTTGDKCAAEKCSGTGECGCTTAEDCKAQEDGNLCNGSLTCEEGKCVVSPGSLVTCPAGTACQTSECIPDTGKCTTKDLAEGDPCNDGDACTATDSCDQGACKGKALVCDDGNLCTTDSCETGTGCTHAFTNAPCDDGVTCTTGDACDLGVCSGVPNADCGCTNDADCKQNEDANACNGTLVCQKVGDTGKCVIDPKTVVVCEPSGTPCAVSVCSPEAGTCSLKNAADEKPCDDGSECTTDDRCKEGKCNGPTEVECDDFNECTTDTCDQELGCRFTANTESCDDGDTCTAGDVCKDSSCQPGPTNTCEDTCQASFTIGCGDFDSWGTGTENFFGSTDVVSAYSCSDDAFEGREYTYLFQAPFAGTVRITLTGETTQTDIHVLAQTEGGCDAKACIAKGYASTEASMEADSSYYFVVDTYTSEVFTDESGDYTLSVDCTPAAELGCDNGFDEDDDGSIDCDDSDCDLDPVCAPVKCLPEWTLSCGSDDAWATYSFGSTNEIDTYDGCDNPFSGNYTGPEYTYVYDAPITGAITVRLTDETALFTDLMVLADASGLCVPSQCLAWGEDSVTFDAVAGTRYYFVVDGWNASEGSYTIDVECPTGIETSCTNGTDDDADDDVDCDDSDCTALPVCAANCNPLFDLDLFCNETMALSTNDPTITKDVTDSYSCNDFDYPGPEASGRFFAPYDGKVAFTLSGETADLDVMVLSDSAGLCLPANCVDSDLTSVVVDVEAFETYYVVIDGYQGETGDFALDITCTPSGELSCVDGLDDDGDNLTDCEDSDCFDSSFACELACQPAESFLADLSCDVDEDTWMTDGTGSSAAVTHYSCNEYSYTGPEYTYTYVAETTGKVSVFLSDESSSDTDLFVLSDKGLGCNPASCLDWDFDTVTFDAVEGTTYYLVVDGFEGGSGDYTINFLCGDL